MPPDDKPQEKATVQLPAVPDWAIELTREVKGARADIGLVSNDLGVVKDRLNIVEAWKVEQDARAAKNSMRAQQSSEVDLDHEAKIAAAIIRQDKLEKAIHDTNALASAAVDTLKDQSDFMGMGKKGIAYLASKEGRAAIMQAAATVAAFYAALKAAGVLR